MYDLKMDAPLEIRGPYKPIKTAVPGIHISEHAPRLAKIMDKLVPIRSMYGSPNGAHDSFICYTGKPPPPNGGGAPVGRLSDPPSLGSVVSRLKGQADPAMPAFIGLAPKAGHPPYGSPGHPGFCGNTHAAFRPNGAGMEDRVRRVGRELHQRFRQQQDQQDVDQQEHRHQIHAIPMGAFGRRPADAVGGVDAKDVRLGVPAG